MMMGADYYETEDEIAQMLKEGKIPLGVGANSRISNCIIDKNARIGKNVVIANTDVRLSQPKLYIFLMLISYFSMVRFTWTGCGFVWVGWQNVQEALRPEEGFYIKTGVTVIEKNGIIKDGTVI
jgi:glucose-1-phosphate adenylyltransferase